MTCLRTSFPTTFRVATLKIFTLLVALGLGAPDAEANSRGASGGRRASPRENLRNAWVTALPLPAGAELSYQPIQAGAASLPNIEIDTAQAEQRANELSADLKTIVPVEHLPAVSTADFLKLRTDALTIVKRHYEESRAALEPDAIGEFAMYVTWTPDFSTVPRTISAADRERAHAASYSVAYAITHLDRPRFVVAYAAAIFALNPDGALEAANAASAIVTSGERRFGTGADAAKLT